MQSFIKRRFIRQLNFTDEYVPSSLNRLNSLDMSSAGFSFNRELTTLTKTQIKVIVTVVFIISFIMLIIAFFRFKNACRTEQTDNLQTDIIRIRTAQYSEPSSRRGSVGYYTQKYNRPQVNTHFDEQSTSSFPNKRLSVPACDPLTKVTAVSVLPCTRGDLTDVKHQHYHVTTSCDTSKISDLKSITYSTTLLHPYDDQTPLLTSTHKNSLNHNTRKYSLNALLPLVRPSNSHPLCSSLTSTIADGTHTGSNNDGSVNLKPCRRASLSISLRRSTFAKQPKVFCSTIDSTIQTNSLDKQTLSYSKDFMHKIDRFRFIDDSASSTTTVTSPVENIEYNNNHRIHTAIGQFDDDMSMLINCLKFEQQQDQTTRNTLQRPQTISKPVTRTARNISMNQTNPMNIPHSITSLPLSKQRYSTEHNGYSRSMDFRSIRDSYDSSSSSTMTLTSQRSLTSLEFDDNSKPSGVLVDDDFLPMSSPIDEHFWNMSTTNSYQSNLSESFPNVGSSPDIEIKQFHFPQSGNSCDEDDDDDSTSSIIQQIPTINTKENLSDPSNIHNSISDQSLIENHSEDDDTQDSSVNELSEGDESADNGEIDLEQEFQLSQTNQLWSMNHQDVYLIESHQINSSPQNSTRPISSIMKITPSKSVETPPEEQQQQPTLKPKVRFNLDPQYEREREWNKVNKLLGNSVEWTDEFEV